MGQQCVRDTCERGGGKDGTEVTFNAPKQEQKSYPVAPGNTDKSTVDIFVTKDDSGRRQGFGKIEEWGYVYEGNFKDDYKEGEGVLTWPDGRQYSGQFVQGKFHGKAVMIWADGRKYEGQYVYGRKHGVGTFIWPDGRRYVGDWNDGRRHGKGVYTNAKKETRSGLWENDRPVQWDVVTGDNSQIPTTRSHYGQ